jgi:hypothetical protein
MQARELPLSKSWRYSGVSKTMFASLTKTAGVEARRIYAGDAPALARQLIAASRPAAGGLAFQS